MASVVAVALGVALVVPGVGSDGDRDRRADAADGPVADAPVTGTAADFTDPAVWPRLPGLPVTTPLLTAEDLDASFPRAGGWGQATVDWGGSWDATGCPGTPSASRPEAHGGVAPTDQEVMVWTTDGQGVSLTRSRFLTVEVFRWSEGAGGGAIPAATWGREQEGVARTCEGVVVLGPAGAPGTGAVVSVSPLAAGSADVDVVVEPGEDAWSVRASTTGGPTGLRLEATVTADTAEQASEQVSALLTRLVERLTAADASVIGATQNPTGRLALFSVARADGSVP